MQFWRKFPVLLRLAALFCALLAAWLPFAIAPHASRAGEELLGDAFWRLGAQTQAERRLVLVDIDDRSLESMGAWPWSRSRMAELSRLLAGTGVQLQAFDITFSDPREGDEQLAAALGATPSVLAQLFSIEPDVAPLSGKAVAPLRQAACPAFAPPSYGLYGLSDTLAAAPIATGHITPGASPDGVVRQVPALVCHEGRPYPALALNMLWRAAQPAGASGEALRPDWQWHERGKAPSPFPPGLTPPAWLSSPSLPGLLVPLDAQGNMRVPYRLARESFASVAAVDVLEGRVRPDLLQGAIVLVGGTAYGMGDTVATPLAAVASGLEVHTQLALGLLDQRLPYTPQAWAWGQYLLMGLAAAMLWWLARRKSGAPAKRLPLAGLLMIGLSLGLTAYALLAQAIWLPWLPLVVFIGFASIGLATVEHAFARAQRERLSAHLGAYLPEPVARRLMASEPTSQVLLESRRAAVMVADIRNFSAFATNASPTEVAALLHAFCCDAVEIVEKHGGMVDNINGGSILAVWLARDDGSAHAVAALQAARELISSTRGLLSARVKVRENSLIQPLALGIGLESGEAIVGSFGPARRRAHAALGEPVSVANRLQQMTSDLSMPIVLGPQLASLLPEPEVEPLGEYLLEGGTGRHSELFAPAGWEELISVDSEWAHSVSGRLDSGFEGSDWKRWSKAPAPAPASERAVSRLLTVPNAPGRPSA